jgi:hypothetical protein
MSVSILVVDDEPDVADLFRQRFRREARQGTYVRHFAILGRGGSGSARGGNSPCTGCGPVEHQHAGYGWAGIALKPNALILFILEPLFRFDVNWCPAMSDRQIRSDRP